MKLKRFINSILWWLALPGCLMIILFVAVFEWLDSDKTYPEAIRFGWQCFYEDKNKWKKEKTIK